MWWFGLLQLKSDKVEARLQAIQRLAKSSGPSAFKALAAAVAGDPEISVRAAAVTAIGRAEAEGATAVLLQALRDPAAEVRAAAIDGLKHEAAERVTGVLFEALKDFDPTVRNRAAHALEQLGWRPANRKEEIWFEAGQGHLGGIAAAGTEAIEPLQVILNGSPCSLQIAAVQALGRIADERVLKLLVPALKSPDHSICVAAIQALSNVGGARATEELIPMFRHQDHRVRVVVIEALVQLETQRIVPALLDLLRDPMWDVRCAAATALGKVRDPQAIEGLAGALQDSDTDVREAAALSLGRINDAWAIGPLVLALVDPETSVRRAAASALQQINPRWPQTEAARRMSPELRRALEADDPAVRYAVVMVLNQLGHAPAAASGHDTATVLTAATQKQNRLLSIFLELLNDPDADLRLAAAKSLGRLADPRAAAALTTLRSDADAAVRRAVAESLQCLGAT